MQPDLRSKLHETVKRAVYGNYGTEFLDRAINEAVDTIAKLVVESKKEDWE